jgi:hypothetical protein
MDVMSTWAEQLAEEVAPGEVDLAAAITTAFVKGGKARRELLQKKKHGSVGSFGGEQLLVFTYILHALANTSILLYTVLASGTLNNFIGIVKHALELREKRGSIRDQ